MGRLLLIILVFISVSCNYGDAKGDKIALAPTGASHDLNLPAWGPYTKKYIGVSHIPDVKKGLRFDLSVFPGISHQKTVVPNVMKKSSFHPWEASPNLEYFSFRHDLIWKDKLFADISYAELDSKGRAFKIVYENNTNEPQEVTAQLMASLHFPPLKAHDPETRINYNQISLPENAFWIDAIDYTELNHAIPGHRDQLVYDGMLKGEIRDHGLINGSGIGKGFGRRKGDELKYRFKLERDIKDAVLLLRYKTEKLEDATLNFKGISEAKITLAASDSLQFQKINLGKLLSGEHEIILKTTSKTRLIIDGFALVEADAVPEVKPIPVLWNDAPTVSKGPVKNSLILKYENLDTYYGLYWNYDDFVIREWFSKDLPDTLHKNDNGIKTQFSGEGKGHFTNVFLKAINLGPKTAKTIEGIVYEGSREAVSEQLEHANTINFEEAFEQANKHVFGPTIIPAGEKYRFSQDRMAANTICNVVYPVHTQKQYIRHHAPGRKWDCLYTWDAGFIGIGLSQLSTQRGVENLNAYLNEPEEQSAFIHHGTPLPVQFYQFHELWNKTQSDSLVTVSYPKLKRYYNFLMGKVPTATTRNLDSGLLRTWDYFYNSGGWDDYPPQKYVHENKLTKKVTPVVSTAHIIRAAKILQMAAMHLNNTADYNSYQKDIEELTSALQEYSWDEESGYYGYVTHNSFNKPSGILKFNESINYNMGLDGVSPLVAGVPNEGQTQKMLSHLKTPGRLWSNMGLSTVDQTAPYFEEKGYWNGSVWMPHQWFFWKAMLDLGEDEFAYNIATNALDIWKRETEKSYNCYEYFSIKDEKGLGWHQFSGLSTPVLSWFNAYYTLGSFTTGNDVWIMDKEWNEDYSVLKVKLQAHHHENKPFSVVVCANPNYEYTALWNGKKTSLKLFDKGVLSITIADTTTKGTLELVPLKH